MGRNGKAARAKQQKNISTDWIVKHGQGKGYRLPPEEPALLN